MRTKSLLCFRMKTGKPPWKKRILPAAALALAAPVLFFAFSLAAHLVSVADFGYPGGEMDFMGLGKNEVLKTVWEKCPRVFSEREMRRKPLLRKPLGGRKRSRNQKRKISGSKLQDPDGVHLFPDTGIRRPRNRRRPTGVQIFGRAMTPPAPACAGNARYFPNRNCAAGGGGTVIQLESGLPKYR